jgi:hypothetical protein
VSRVNVAVAVTDDAQGRIHEIAAACRALGLTHRATLAVVGVGVSTGSMESADLAKLRTVPGVLAVEVEYAFRWRITGRRTRCYGAVIDAAQGEVLKYRRLLENDAPGPAQDREP